MNNTSVVLSFVLYSKALLPASTGLHLFRQRENEAIICIPWSAIWLHVGTQPREGSHQVFAPFKIKSKSCYTLLDYHQERRTEKSNRIISRKSFLAWFSLPSAFRWLWTSQKSPLELAKIYLWFLLSRFYVFWKQAWNFLIHCKAYDLMSFFFYFCYWFIYKIANVTLLCINKKADQRNK